MSKEPFQRLGRPSGYCLCTECKDPVARFLDGGIERRLPPLEEAHLFLLLASSVKADSKWMYEVLLNHAYNVDLLLCALDEG